MKTAIIFGITGQDGAYLAQLLLGKGYKVFGGYRRSSGPTTWRLQELGILDQVTMVACEMTEDSSIRRLIKSTQPDEVYNLAAQSFVGASFEVPIYTADADGLGVLRILEAIREINPEIRFYQASTSELFGKVHETPQRETTPFHPRSPYGVAKLFAHWTTVNYRESYGIHASSGILFNHESPLRGLEFVTRKIVHGLMNIRAGKSERLMLGNLDARRDWGFAGDFVEGMWRMVQQPEGGDYVLATGVTTSIRDFVNMVAERLGMSLGWSGSGTHEVATDLSDKVIIAVDPKFYRPAEVELLQGDATRAKEILGWRPRFDLKALIDLMVVAELRRSKL